MRKWFAGIVLFLSIVLLSISIYFLMGMYQQEKKEDRTYQKISDLYENEDFDGTEEPETTEEESINAGLIALHGENEDCIRQKTKMNMKSLSEPVRTGHFIILDCRLILVTNC